MLEEDPHRLEAERRAAAKARDDALKEAFRFEEWWQGWPLLWRLAYAPGILLAKWTSAYAPVSINCCFIAGWGTLLSIGTLALQIRHEGLDGAEAIASYAIPVGALLYALYGLAFMPREYMLVDRKKLVKHVWALEELQMNWPAAHEICWDKPWADRERVERLCLKLISQLEKSPMV